MDPPLYPEVLPMEGLSIPLELENKVKQTKIEELLKPIILTPEIIARVRQVFEEELELGLTKDPPVKSSLHMENTFIPQLPNGTEDGEFLGMDLGGTNFRVLRTQFSRGHMTHCSVERYTVPDQLRLGHSIQLFDFLAECIEDFMKKNDLLHQRVPLGFTFSFPMIQKALNIGILVTWTKTFQVSGAIGQDAVQMLNEAIARRKDLHVDVVAVLNDSAGTLVQGAFLDHRTGIGLILGTGCNGCYLEKVDKVKKWEGDQSGVSEVVIDTELGAFGDNGIVDFLKSEYDREVDRNSLIVQSYTFEKYIAGKYLGEVVRCILLKLYQEKLLFAGHQVEQLQQPGTFTTTYVSEIERDLENTENTERILKEYGVSEFSSQEDISVIRYVCSLASIRSARLVAICLSVLLQRMNRKFTTIAVDGSLYKHHPKLNSLLTHFTAEMSPGQKFQLMLAEDGSGIGAALVAAIADRLHGSKNKS